MNDAEVLRIKRRAEDALLALPGVHAVGLGGKETGGEPTGKLSICVFVVKKKPISDLVAEERIPSMIEGVPTDVVESPIPTVSAAVLGAAPGVDLNDADRQRPLIGGTQIFRRGGPLYGTLGCFFTVDGQPNRVLAVTNHHVFYKTASTAPNHEIVGQPTDEDSCTRCCSDVIGQVYDSQCDEDVDISLVELRAGERWLRDVMQIGPIQGTDTVTPSVALARTYQVQKRGRSTQHTGGVVIMVDKSGDVLNEDRTLFRKYRGAIVIKGNPDPNNPIPRRFSSAGDSGSAVLSLENKLIGFLFASSPKEAADPTSLVMPIQPIIDKFGNQVEENRRIKLVLATTSVANQVQTVPAAALNMLSPSEPASETPQGQVPESINPALNDPDSTQPPVLHGARLRLDLSQSQIGRLWLDGYLRHSKEVRRLLDNNRRFATLWHRSGGAGLFQSLVRAFHDPQVRVPLLINGRSISQCVDAVAAALSQYGSAELKRDLPQALACVPDVAGKTYAEILELLKSLDSTATSQTA